MKLRQNIVDTFSTFIQLDENYFQGWLADPRLRRRSMEHCLQAASSTKSESYWVIYWHQVWQAQISPLATGHLTAYLQEVCYFSVKKIATNFPSKQSLADLFQTAIANLPKILKGFNSQLSSNLKGYADLTFSNLTKDSLRKHQEINICTNWGLLHKLSQKGLRESLEFAGLSDHLIPAYILAWNCFRELTAPVNPKNTRKLSPPDAETWEAIAKLYHAQRLKQPGDVLSNASSANLEKWLLICTEAVRAFQFPRVVSANTPLPGQEMGELLDNLPSVEELLLNQLIVAEEIASRQTQKAQLGEILSQAIAKLDPQVQILIKTYYEQNLTQQQIAQQTGIKQYSISRKLASARTVLLRTIAEWSQEALHIPLSAEVLDSMDILLEEWLQQR
jgi:RNA polymerase sigma factor (sigma-70 family)